MLAVSDDTVIRLFGHREGVIDLGSPETMHKRKKRMLRISRVALDLFLSEMQVKARRA